MHIFGQLTKDNFNLSINCQGSVKYKTDIWKRLVVVEFMGYGTPDTSCAETIIVLLPEVVDNAIIITASVSSRVTDKTGRAC